MLTMTFLIYPQHVTNENFQGQGEPMNVGTLAPLGLSIVEAENQRTTKHPQILGFKETQLCVEAIKKIRERELHCPQVVVGVPFTMGPWATTASKPLTSCFFSKDLDGNETRPNTKS